MTDHQWFKAGSLDETKPSRKTRNTDPSDSAASWVTETALVKVPWRPSGTPGIFISLLLVFGMIDLIDLQVVNDE